MTSSTSNDQSRYRKRSSCASCGHKHRQGQYCHVFVESSTSVSFLGDVEGRRNLQDASTNGEGWSEERANIYEDWIEDDEIIPGKAVKIEKSWAGEQAEQVLTNVKTFVNRFVGGQGGGKNAATAATDSAGDSDSAIEDNVRSMSLEENNGSTLEIEAGGEEGQEGGEWRRLGVDNNMPDEEREREEEALQEQSFLNQHDDGDAAYQNENASAEALIERKTGTSLRRDMVSNTVLQGDELNEPSFITDIGMRRCACRIGVPKGNRAYIPVPEARYVTGILINTSHIDDDMHFIPRCPPPTGLYVGITYRFVLFEGHIYIQD